MTRSLPYCTEDNPGSTVNTKCQALDLGIRYYDLESHLQYGRYAKQSKTTRKRRQIKSAQ